MYRITLVLLRRSLCLKFPRKHGSLLTFLSGMLRDEGGFDYKKAIVESIFAIIENNPESKENGLFASHISNNILLQSTRKGHISNNNFTAISNRLENPAAYFYSIKNIFSYWTDRESPF